MTTPEAVDKRRGDLAARMADIRSAHQSAPVDNCDTCFLLSLYDREVERRREAEAELRFWRQEMAAKLELSTALAKRSQAGSARTAERRNEMRTILNAFRDADAKEWHLRCVECNEFIVPGEPTVTIGGEDDFATAHAKHFPDLPPEACGVEDAIDEAAVRAKASAFLRDDAPVDPQGGSPDA